MNNCDTSGFEMNPGIILLGFGDHINIRSRNLVRYDRNITAHIHLRLSAFICLYLRLKKENFLTADENGLTQIHAEVEKRYLNNIEECLSINI